MIIAALSIYVLLIVLISVGYHKVKKFAENDLDEKIAFSIIIPFRNEAKALPGLLRSIQKLNYDKELYQVLLIDDYSEDNSQEIINSLLREERLDFTIIKNKRKSNSPKKDAIELAVNHAKYKWIITTDADCKVTGQWLKTLSNFIITKNPNMVVAPVSVADDNSFLNGYQELDILSLQTATIGMLGLGFPIMANGANLAYKKDVFLKLNPYKNNKHKASGDDIFLLESFTKYDKEKVHFLKSKEASIYTKSEDSWYNVIQQRKRWASKASASISIMNKFVGLIVLITNASLVILWILVIAGLKPKSLLLLFLLVKGVVDLFAIYLSARFFNKQSSLKHFVSSSLLYPFLSTYIVVTSLFSKYKWKGRSFK